MFIELLDFLRCLAPHEETWLVASAWRMDGRHLVEGILGCPVCRREYPVRDGVGWFDTDAPAMRTEAFPTAPTADDERIARAAALLGLSEPGGILALGGDWADCAEGLAALEPAHVVILNGAPSPDRWPRVSSLHVAERLPFAAGSVRGVALGRAAEGAGPVVTDALLASGARALRARGRLVAPASAPVPEGVVELARDDVDWVAERRAVPSPPVALRSARR